VTEIQKAEIRDVLLPLANQAQAPEKADSDRFIINVEEDGSYYIGNRKLTTKEMATLLKREGVKSRDDAGLSTRFVLIRAHKEVQYRYIAGLMYQCQQANIWKLAFASIPKGEG
jgi:biopolymer transport protein ExbD